MRLYLARHGQTTSNVIRALDTAAPGADLTDLGREQARDLAIRLDDYPIDGILVSHKVRTQQTAEPTAQRKGLTPRIDPRIAEVAAGDWEMTTDRDVLMSYFKVAMGWMAGDYDLSTPNGETGHQVIERFNVRANGPQALAGDLSGGNIQRVILARAFARRPRLLVLHNPTRGLDIRSTQFVYEQVHAAAESGCAVLLISEDLDEVITLSDRIVSLYSGRSTGEWARGEGDRYEIGRSMTGLVKSA